MRDEVREMRDERAQERGGGGRRGKRGARVDGEKGEITRGRERERSDIDYTT